MDIDGLRRYAVIDPDANTGALELCMNAAVGALAAMGVKPMMGSALYDLTVYQLATHYHEHRADGEATAIPTGVMAAVLQLKWAPVAAKNGGVGNGGNAGSA